MFSKKNRFLIIDIGGTGITAYIVTHGKDKEFSHKIVSIHTPEKFDEFENFLEDIKDKYFLHNNISGIVAGVPGEYDFNKDVIVNFPNIEKWNGRKLRSRISSIFRLESEKVFPENDVNLITLGENYKGVGKKWKNFVLLAIGTGLGCGIVINGELFRGRDVGACEIGHTLIKPDGFICSCGKKGCLEAYVSGKGLVNIYSNIGGDSNMTAKEIAHLCSEKDTLSEKAFQLLGKYLGWGIANIINIFNPDGVVLSGGVLQSYNCFDKITYQSAKERIFLKQALDTPIEKSEITDHSFWGGIALLKEKGVIHPL